MARALNAALRTLALDAVADNPEPDTLAFRDWLREAAVCGLSPGVHGNLPTLPDHTVVAVSCESPEEAHYIAALLNSSLVRLTIRGYVVLHPSPHIMEQVGIPRYDKGNKLHRQLAGLSKSAHELDAGKMGRTLLRIEEEIDTAAGELWGLSPGELGAIRGALPQLAAPLLDRQEDE